MERLQTLKEASINKGDKTRREVEGERGEGKEDARRRK